jgi:hypothetical protein
LTLCSPNSTTPLEEIESTGLIIIFLVISYRFGAMRRTNTFGAAGTLSLIGKPNQEVRCFLEFLPETRQKLPDRPFRAAPDMNREEWGG